MITAENVIVVDKNIWLDFYLHERPLHEDAVRFIRVAEKYCAHLGTPADAVNEGNVQSLAHFHSSIA